jgi:hypothetical protein
MHTEICAIPLCIQGIDLIPICIRGLHFMRSPYAYGDLRDPHMIWGLIFIPVCIWELGVGESLCLFLEEVKF